MTRAAWLLMSPIVLASVLAGCGDNIRPCPVASDCAAPPEQVAVASPAVPSRNLDDPPLGAGDSAEIDMIPGRLNKVPVSWFFEHTLRTDNPQKVAFRTTDCAGPADTGLIVTWNDPAGPHTAFNNDGGGQGRCSYIDTGFHAGPVAFTVYVFSMIRGTSQAALQVSLDGQPWNTIRGDHFGGTLVRVGALHRGDYVEVQTPSDGVRNDGTRMLLFQVPPEQGDIVNTAAIFNDEQNSGDRDPRIEVDAAWPSTQNAVLLGKDTRSSTSRGGIEAHVDLVRGPLEVTAPDPAFDCKDSACSVVLPPGRYFASLFANTESPLGHVTKGAEHCADDMGTDDEGDCPHKARGQGNDRAFTAIVRRNGVEVQRRLVPRGLLGNDPELGWNQIVFEVDTDGSGSYSLHAEDRAPDVSFFPHWRYIRNPDVSEIKVATWNFGYWIFEDSTYRRIAILKNAADLLGTRGEIDPDPRTIVERANQAPWQWDADVIAFQEFYGTTYPHVRDRLAQRSPFQWSVVNANTEVSEGLVSTEVYYGPVFVNELVRPANGIKYSDLQLNDGVSEGRCNSRWEGANYDYACPLGVYDRPGPWNSYNRAVPVRLRAQRGMGRNASVDRPVAFFNWHLFHNEDAFDQRATNVENLMKSVKYLMARPADGSHALGACSFNKECVNHPKHYANRILIMGDSNMKSHQCGEFAWTLRRLREQFGYAIDASAAVVDHMNRTYDLHWSGAPLTDPRTSCWGTCQQANGPWSKTVNADGRCTCPFQFQHRGNWNDAVDFSTASWYPWWATTTVDPEDPNKGGGRFDVVFLVGRGWAYDDPVLTYRVMPHRQEEAPTNGMLGGGVEMGFNEDTCEGTVADGQGNYAPNVGVGACGTGEGKPAILSDHIPVGARLRIWGR